jgi:hypothetical protein
MFTFPRVVKMTTSHDAPFSRIAWPWYSTAALNARLRYWPRTPRTTTGNRSHQSRQ